MYKETYKVQSILKKKETWGLNNAWSSFGACDTEDVREEIDTEVEGIRPKSHLARRP